MWPGDALPQQGKTNWKFFYASGNDWQAYMKPPGASMIYIFMIASGGGGSRVADGAVTTTAAGAGGGCGGTSRMLIPATFLPDVIYVQPGVGGLGATAPSTNGTNGATSYVSVEPSISGGDVIFQQEGGRASINQTVSGAAGPVGVITSGFFASLGLWFSRGGQNGGNGGIPSGGLVATGNEQGIITTAGSGGGRGSGVGGTINATGIFPAVSAVAAQGANGSDGFQKGLILGSGLKSGILYFTGGVGGNGTTAASAAGKGGDAAYGGGGGGGGASTNAGGTSGNGGNGGDGLIIIGTF